jgi:hypothetical protein
VRVIRILLLALVAAQALAQSQLYIDISDGWSFVGGNGNSTVNIGYAGRGLTLGNQPVTLQRSVELADWVDRSQLALTVGPVRERYTVFANGQKIARVGKPDTFVDANLAQTRTFSIPASAAGARGPLSIVLQLDRAGTAAGWWRPVGYTPSLITYRSNAPLSAADDDMALRRMRLTPCLVLAVVFLLLGVQVLVGWLRERNRPELIWFAAFLLLAFAYNARTYAIMAPHSTPYNALGEAWITQIIQTARFAAFTSFVIAALQFRLRWLHAGIWLLWAAFAAYLASAGQFLGYPSFLLYKAYVLLVSVAAFFVGLAGWRRTFLGMPAFTRRMFVVLLLLKSGYSLIVSASYFFPRNLKEYTFAGGYYFIHYDPFTLVLGISILMLLLKQAESDRRQRQRLASEMNAARSAQQFLLGHGASMKSGGFVIDPVYEPANEVGGDFYQILPLQDGAVLVVVGDVSGKGLRAAMVVSMVIGLVRSHASLSPGALLEHINRAIAGRLDGGFVTCAVLRIEKDGCGVVANAGHPPLYRGGREEPVEPGLPLGIDPEATYTEVSLEASAITLVSDGVVEAANATGELFGFERTREISARSAREIADAARAWGQNDDITVVSVRRASA